MTRLQELSDEQKIVVTVLLDRYRIMDEPASAQEIAAATAWPGARTFGVGRTRRILRELRDEGLAHRLNFGSAGDGDRIPRGVRWQLDAAGYKAARDGQ